MRWAQNFAGFMIKAQAKRGRLRLTDGPPVVCGPTIPTTSGAATSSTFALRLLWKIQPLARPDLPKLADVRVVYAQAFETNPAQRSGSWKASMLVSERGEATSLRRPLRWPCRQLYTDGNQALRLGELHKCSWDIDKIRHR
jgi:hypothetical protein